MCPLPARCQKLDLGLYFLARSGWRRYGLPSGAAPEGSRETEPPTQRPGEAEPPAQRSGKPGPPTQRSGEAEPAHLGVCWSYSRALGCSDESILMIISSSSGTLVLVPDTKNSHFLYFGVKQYSTPPPAPTTRWPLMIFVECFKESENFKHFLQFQS